MKKQVWLIFSTLLLGFSIVSAQTATRVPKTISGGVVNGKAKNLAIPVYPAAARAAGAKGTVNVKVIIDETGNVVSASAVSGPPLLRQSAETAAFASKFSPTLLQGQPVKVTGTIVYNFVEDKNNEEKVKMLGLGTVLFLLRNSAADLSKLDDVFGPQGLLESMPQEFPQYSKEISPLLLLEKTPDGKRLEIIDGVISSVRTKLSGSDNWQFELGESFGEFMSPFLQTASEENVDINKLDEQSLRLNLTKIKDLSYSAPPDFPPDVLEKFKQFADVDAHKKLLTPENFQDFFKKLGELFETIAPGSTK